MVGRPPARSGTALPSRRGLARRRTLLQWRPPRLRSSPRWNADAAAPRRLLRLIWTEGCRLAQLDRRVLYILGPGSTGERRRQAAIPLHVGIVGCSAEGAALC